METPKRFTSTPDDKSTPWNFKARTDILNVIKIVKPNPKDLYNLKPDIHHLINRGMASSVNIGKEEEMKVYGKLADSKIPPPGSKLKLQKLEGKTLAQIGF